MSLKGSVRRAGGSVRVTGRMIDASTGAHVWAERYDRSSDDVFARQKQITRFYLRFQGRANVDGPVAAPFQWRMTQAVLRRQKRRSVRKTEI